jgi:hypothetical protein
MRDRVCSATWSCPGFDRGHRVDDLLQQHRVVGVGRRQRSWSDPPAPGRGVHAQRDRSDHAPGSVSPGSAAWRDVAAGKPRSSTIASRRPKRLGAPFGTPLPITTMTSSIAPLLGRRHRPAPGNLTPGIAPPLDGAVAHRLGPLPAHQEQRGRQQQDREQVADGEGDDRVPSPAGTDPGVEQCRRDATRGE